MTYIKRAFLFSVMALCSFSTWALDTYIYFAHYPETPKSQRHSYTIRAGGSRQDMYGVYNPGIAHVSKGAADVTTSTPCPNDYVRVHWKSSVRQSYQDFVVTQDDDPSVKATFRWYRPYRGDSYVTIFSNPNHLINSRIDSLWFNYGCTKPYHDDSAQDILVFIN